MGGWVDGWMGGRVGVGEREQPPAKHAKVDDASTDIRVASEVSSVPVSSPSSPSSSSSSSLFRNHADMSSSPPPSPRRTVASWGTSSPVPASMAAVITGAQRDRCCFGEDGW